MQFWNRTRRSDLVNVKMRFIDRILSEFINDGLNIRPDDGQDN